MSVSESLKIIISPDIDDKEWRFEIKALRNNSYHVCVPELCEYPRQSSGEKTEVLFIEAMEWVNYNTTFHCSRCEQ